MDGARPDALTQLERQVIDHYHVLRPTRAASLGLHEYDGKLPDLSTDATERWAHTARGLLEQLAETGDSELPGPRRLDRRLLQLLLEGALFDLEDVREFDRNPMAYLFQPDLTDYLVREYAPVADRLGAVIRILNAVPSLLEVARRRLEPVLPRPFVTLSIPIALGLPDLFAESSAFAANESASLRSSLAEARAAAEAAVRGFADWLKAERLANANDDFALGRERFQRLLWVREGLTTPVEEVLRRGRADLARNQARLAEIARAEAAPVEQLVARLNDQHPTAAELIPVATRLTDDARAFVRERELATIPEPEVCHVRETPAWARDLWTAALSPPGPFEKPVDGIYWITSVNPAWTPAQQEEWMRTYNFAMLKNTTVHEVWPGHYLQALHFRRTEQSLARRVWWSYSFTEGWAHYCEQVALEAGYDGGSVAAEVTQLKDALIRDGRLVASIGMHTQGLSVAAATQMLRTEAHLEAIHAEREAIRGTYNPEYFCYTLGKLEILDVRAKHLAGRYHSSLKEFHDALLGFGAPPIGYLEPLVAGRSVA